jgi:hypothetical protein
MEMGKYEEVVKERDEYKTILEDVALALELPELPVAKAGELPDLVNVAVKERDAARWERQEAIGTGNKAAVELLALRQRLAELAKGEGE